MRATFSYASISHTVGQVLDQIGVIKNRNPRRKWRRKRKDVNTCMIGEEVHGATH